MGRDPFALDGKRILVTGGTRGIGRAISWQLACAGASVLANYVHNDAMAESLRAEAKEAGLAIQICRADLTSKKGLDALAAEVGPPDMALSALVHCAATGVHRPIDALTTRHLDWTFALNVRAFFDLVLLLLPRLREGASVLAVSSEGAVRAVPFYTVVGASKGALEAMARHLAVELAPRGVRVNILSPGSILTEAWDAFPDKEARLEKERARTPRGRLVTLSEVGQVAQFLCSDAASGIVGQTVVVDGGKGIVG